MSDLPTFHKYLDIERLGHEENYGLFSEPTDVIVIQEKIDGGNAQFRVWEGELLFGSRNNQFKLTDANSPQLKQFGKNANWLVDKMSENFVAGKTWAEVLHPDYIYYGEWCKKHTINYDWARTPQFMGFDIYNTLTHIYLPYEAVKAEYERLGLSIVPLILKTTVAEIDVARLENFIGNSAYYEGRMEGIVIKNYFRRNVYGRQMFAKLVTQSFKEANMAAFGGGVKDLQDDTSRFLTAFYTEARIRKAILRLKDEQGLPIDRTIMHVLPRAVIEDIMKEECWLLVKDFNTLQFNLIKKQAPKLCLLVVDKMMSERAIEAKNE
jgi:hypothetical protein